MSTFDHFVGTRPVSEQHTFDVAALTAWMSGHVDGFAGPLQVEMGQGDTATVRFTVLLTGGDGRFLPERGQLQQVVSHWRLADDQWRLYSASWSPTVE